jgi:D-tagatose-1,6-bisphosphate aldolase subunit GatZ/KbaZ
MKKSLLSEIVNLQNMGQTRGVASICSAHPTVLEAALRHGLLHGQAVLIESTCNQVNQFGGYTGMKPAEFVAFVGRLARIIGFPEDNLILGGDHLGPNPWQDETADVAMGKAKELVRRYVSCGDTKIHLDASMKCADDEKDRPLPKRIAAQRAAEMALVAEEALKQSRHKIAPHYVIGTEVPVPGGAQEHEETVEVATAEEAAETIEISRQAFLQKGLDEAWQRVIAVVVQPGVEFGDSSLFEYDALQAAHLSRLIEAYDNLVYEAHSTDYQTREKLRELVRDHFAILKVGPGLTFAYREGVFALAMIEEEWLSGKQGIELSNLLQVVEEVMLQDPAYWRSYYPGETWEQRFSRRYSFSDRIRYYWPVPQVQSALNRMLENLSKRPIPLTLLSQYMPVQAKSVRQERLSNSPEALLLDKVFRVLDDYAFACRPELASRQAKTLPHQPLLQL